MYHYNYLFGVLVLLVNDSLSRSFDGGIRRLVHPDMRLLLFVVNITTCSPRTATAGRHYARKHPRMGDRVSLRGTPGFSSSLLSDGIHSGQISCSMASGFFLSRSIPDSLLTGIHRMCCIVDLAIDDIVRFAGPAIGAGSIIFSGSIMALVLNRDR